MATETTCPGMKQPIRQTEVRESREPIVRTEFTVSEVSKRINGILEKDSEYAEMFNALTASRRASIVEVATLMCNTFDSFEDLEQALEQFKMNRGLEGNVS